MAVSIDNEVDSLIDFEISNSKAEDDTDISQMKEYVLEAEKELQNAGAALECALSEKSIVDKHTMSNYM